MLDYKLSPGKQPEMRNGVMFHSKDLRPFSSGFYVDGAGAQYLCLSEFLLEYSLPLNSEFVLLALREVLREFPGINIIEFAG